MPWRAHRHRYLRVYNEFVTGADEAVKARVTSRMVVAADRPTVFEYLRNLKYHFLWNPHLRTITPLTTLKEGMTYRTTSLLLGITVSGNNRVSRLVPASELKLENSTGSLKYNVNYRLKPKADGTELTCTTEVTADGNAFAFASPVLKLLAQRELQTDLEALKIAVEQRLK